MNAQGQVSGAASPLQTAGWPEGRSFETARVRIIGFEALGDDDRIALGARLRTESLRFLHHFLQADDVVVPSGDEFLIVLCHSPGRDFAADTLAIATGLNAVYAGEASTRSLQAEVSRESTDPETMASLLGVGAAAAFAQAQRHPFPCLPVWEAKKEAVTAYWLAPPPNERSPMHGYDASWLESRIHSDADYLNLDVANVDCAIEEAERCLAGGLHCQINYSAHATTMQHRSRRQTFLAHLSTAPERVRPYLAGRIAEIEPGTPVATITEWVRLLRPVSSRIIIQLHESEASFEGLDQTGAACASITLSSRQHSAKGKEACARHIQRWGVKLRLQRLQFRLDNVEDPGLLTLALTSGVGFMTSERCWPRVSEPAGVRMFPRSQFGQLT